MNWFVAFGKRLVLSTPVFFKWVIGFGITLGVIGTGLIQYSGDLPVWIRGMADNLIIIGVVSTTVSAAVVKHPEQIR